MITRGMYPACRIPCDYFPFSSISPSAIRSLRKPLANLSFSDEKPFLALSAMHPSKDLVWSPGWALCAIIVHLNFFLSIGEQRSEPPGSSADNTPLQLDIQISPATSLLNRLVSCKCPSSKAFRGLVDLRAPVAVKSSNLDPPDCTG